MLCRWTFLVRGKNLPSPLLKFCSTVKVDLTSLLCHLGASPLQKSCTTKNVTPKFIQGWIYLTSWQKRWELRLHYHRYCSRGFSSLIHTIMFTSKNVHIQKRLHPGMFTSKNVCMYVYKNVHIQECLHPRMFTLESKFKDGWWGDHWCQSWHGRWSH